MKVSEVMTKSPAFCTPEMGLQAAAKMMCDSDCGMLPVVENRQSMKPVGLLTDRDIACRVVARGKTPVDVQVSDCMTSPVLTVTPGTDIDACCELLEVRKIRRVPVVDERGRLCGIVALADIARKCGLERTGAIVREVSLASV